MATDDFAPLKTTTVKAPAAAEPSPTGKLMEITGGQDGTVKPDGTFVGETDAIVDRWFSDTFPGSVVARDTPTWNFVSAAKDDLKRRLQRKEG